jgi:hypothetical protein
MQLGRYISQKQNGMSYSWVKPILRRPAPVNLKFTIAAPRPDTSLLTHRFRITHPQIPLKTQKFFDRVNHDVLMARLARRIEDKQILRVIRRYIQAGMTEGGLVSPRTEGTPQGGPLSPLLSNIPLDELDRELEQRGHAFVRYADDRNIYVQSQQAGQRVLDSIERFLQKRLRLKVNR